MSNELSATTKFEWETKPQNSTETALFYTACYGFVLCLIIKLKLYVKRKMLGFCR